MKLRIALLGMIALLFPVIVSAQTAEEIIDYYFENTGGIDNWRSLTGMKAEATINSQGMDIPITMISLKDGRQLFKFVLQGQEVVQRAYDGEVVWGVNFMTMQPEKSDQETTENTKRQSKEFLDPFLNYKELGFTIELLGKEDAEGVECFKIKLVKNTMLVDGEEVDNVAFYYFDSENFVPIVVESDIRTGQMKGNTSRVVFSDYQEVEGLYFPFSITEGIKGADGAQAINFTSIVLNPEVDDSVFKMPEPVAEESTDGDK